MLSKEGGEPATGDKIKAKGSFENGQEEFEDGVCDPDYAKAISIWGSPNDAHGHSEQIRFRANSLYLRLAMELMAREPSFHVVSNFHRTVYRPACGVISKKTTFQPTSVRPVTKYLAMIHFFLTKLCN